MVPKKCRFFKIFTRFALFSFVHLCHFVIDKNPRRVCLNDQIETSDGQFGVVRFIGETEFGEGVYYGLEMEPKEGKNDGTVQGVRYFHTDYEKALFVRINQIVSVTRGN